MSPHLRVSPSWHRAAVVLVLSLASARCASTPIAPVRIQPDRPLASQIGALAYLPADTIAAVVCARVPAVFMAPALPPPYALPELEWARELRPFIDEQAPMGVAVWDPSAMVVVWFSAVTDASAAEAIIRRNASRAGTPLSASRSGESRILSAPQAGVDVVWRGPWMFVLSSQVSSRREALAVRIANLSPDEGLRAQPGFTAAMANAAHGDPGGADAVMYIDGSGLANLWLARTSEPTLWLADVLTSLGRLAARVRVHDTALEIQLGAQIIEQSLLARLTEPEPGATAPAEPDAQPNPADWVKTVQFDGLALAAQLIETLGRDHALPALPELPQDENQDVPFSPAYQALLAEYTATRERAEAERASFGQFAIQRIQHFGQALGSAHLSLTRTGAILSVQARLDFQSPDLAGLYQRYAGIARELAAETERTRATLDDLIERVQALHIELVRIRARDVQAWDLR
jgi:hypothetical protein